MSNSNRIKIINIFVSVAAVSFMLVLNSCSEQPAAIDQEPLGGGDLAGTGEIDPSATDSFLLGAVTDSTLENGYIEVWAMDVAYDKETGIVSFDVQLLNETDDSIEPPVHFVITQISPFNIAVVEFDGSTGDGFPFYDFSTKLGEDGVLEPGERTESVSMKFHTVETRSFAIAFRIDLGPPEGGGTISGVVFHDENQNGIRDRFENGILGITIALKKTLQDGDRVTLLTRTDRDGAYRFLYLGADVYEVSIRYPMESWLITTPSTLLITLVEGSGGEVQDFYGANFGLYPKEQPPAPGIIFGPVMVGPFSAHGTMLDSIFTDPPSPLPVVYKYYLDVAEPPILSGPFPIVVDTASAWINGELVFEYIRTESPDSIGFQPRRLKLPEGLVTPGENSIHLLTEGNEHAALMWSVYKEN